MPFSEFSKTADGMKAVLMLKTLVVPDDKEAEVKQVLRKYDSRTDGDVSSSKIDDISRAHLAESSRNVRRTTSDYTSDIFCAKDCYAFFSIPNDSGWSCEVNGESAEILDINGFMAVRIGDGTNRIEFRYTVPGLRAGILLTAASLVISVIYILIMRRRKPVRKS